jgi:NADH:ubiquinone oxidoreductase subunit F (NADH-binding)
VIPPSPIPYPTEIDVLPGPALLDGIERGPSWGAHRRQYGDLPPASADDLLRSAEAVGLRGRGGAGFPFATKLRAVLGARGRSRPVVVVNLSEGEPASAKDSALARHRPHLVLDGAVAAGRALRADAVHVVLPGERQHTRAAVRAALAERPDEGVRFHVHEAASRFVAGQARAVIELLSGRPNLPVTGWQPDAVSGLDGRPTLLSNAETWAHLARLVLLGEREVRRHGTAAEPGTTLLSVTAPGGPPVVVEAEYGGRLRDALPGRAQGRPALVGGFHGCWATALTLANARVSGPGTRALGMPLGAGVVHVPAPDACPFGLTSRIVDYLAGQSAGRCGPCLNGLPALADALRAVVEGRGGLARVEELFGLVERRGACAHPDGTVRLVRSLLSTWPAGARDHALGGCTGGLGGCAGGLREAS